jgi:tripartite-type tricarboxylate transporter receptor subunit TctC
VNHLALILLMRQTGIEVTPVPYNGNQPIHHRADARRCGRRA